MTNAELCVWINSWKVLPVKWTTSVSSSLQAGSTGFSGLAGLAALASADAESSELQQEQQQGIARSIVHSVLLNAFLNG